MVRGSQAQTLVETDMRTIVLVFSLIVMAAPSHAASLEQKCREMVGKEQPEAEGLSHVGRFQAQRFSDCMMGVPR
jgi:hypothetical protein